MAYQGAYIWRQKELSENEDYDQCTLDYSGDYIWIEKEGSENED